MADRAKVYEMAQWARGQMLTRMRVLPRRVRQRLVTQEQADHEIAVMKATYQLLRDLARVDRLVPVRWEGRPEERPSSSGNDADHDAGHGPEALG